MSQVQSLNPKHHHFLYIPWDTLKKIDEWVLLCWVNAHSDTGSQLTLRLMLFSTKSRVYFLEEEDWESRPIPSTNWEFRHLLIDGLFTDSRTKLFILRRKFFDFWLLVTVSHVLIRKLTKKSKPKKTQVANIDMFYAPLHNYCHKTWQFEWDRRIRNNFYVA